MFKTKKQEDPAPVAPQRPATTRERLEIIRANKESQLRTLNAELVDLDRRIAWLQRFPQVEEIFEYLRGQ
jgi:hypothetical protein